MCYSSDCRNVRATRVEDTEQGRQGGTRRSTHFGSEVESSTKIYFAQIIHIYLVQRPQISMSCPDTAQQTDTGAQVAEKKRARSVLDLPADKAYKFVSFPSAHVYVCFTHSSMRPPSPLFGAPITFTLQSLLAGYLVKKPLIQNALSGIFGSGLRAMGAMSDISTSDGGEKEALRLMVFASLTNLGVTFVIMAGASVTGQALCGVYRNKGKNTRITLVECVDGWMDADWMDMYVDRTEERVGTTLWPRTKDVLGAS